MSRDNTHRKSGSREGEREEGVEGGKGVVKGEDGRGIPSEGGDGEGEISSTWECEGEVSSDWMEGNGNEGGEVLNCNVRGIEGWGGHKLQH